MHYFRKFSLIFLLALAGALLYVGVSLAQQGNQPTDDQVNAIASQLYCPVCENIPLDVCGTQACEQWREQIRQMLAEGKTEREIKDYFVAQFGDRVIGRPPTHGINWLVYIFPPIAILVGAYILFRAFQSWKRPVTQPSESPQAEKDEYVSRLEEELRKRA